MTLRLPDPTDVYDVDYMRALVLAIEQQGIGQVIGSSRLYVIKNFTSTRQIDLATATQTQINNFLMTLADDLIKRSVLS